MRGVALVWCVCVCVWMCGAAPALPRRQDGGEEVYESSVSFRGESFDSF